MKFKAIGFDYGGVISGPTGAEYNRAICGVLDIGLEEYRTAYFRSNSLVNNGHMSWAVFYENLLKELNRVEKAEALRKFLNDWPGNRINQEVLDLAGKMRVSGYKTGILSNNTVEKFVLMNQLGMEKYFDKIIVSAVLGKSKPDPEFFNFFFEELGVKPKEVIFIDDAERNITAIEKLGSTGILYTDYDSLLIALRDLGVTF